MKKPENSAVHVPDRQLAQEAEEVLAQLEEFDDTPEAMGYFYSLFRNSFVKGQPAVTGMVIGTMCVLVPDELILAAGATPLRVCNGSYRYAQAGADLMPAKSCPLVAATLGFLNSQEKTLKEQLKGLVIPTSCDQKRKMAELLEDSPYTICSLEMPSSKESDISRYYWQQAVKQFSLDLKQLTGKRITKKSLREAIAKKIRASALFRKLYGMQELDKPVIQGKDMLLVTNGFFQDRIDSWIGAVEELLEELQLRRQNEVRVGSSKSPRLLMTGSPAIFPHLKVPLLVEQAGGIIVADEFCSSSRLLYDAVSFDENNLDEMVSALADKYLKPCTCPCLSPNSDRKRKLEEMAKRFKVDGIIYQAFSGCLPYEMERLPITRLADQLSLPLLYVETDYSPEDQAQLSTRVEAFLESIKRKKKKKTALKKEAV